MRLVSLSRSIAWWIHPCYAFADLCALPVDPGPCEVPVSKWFYNLDTGHCQQFTFGGCLGNDNKFDSKSICESVCPVTGGSEITAWGYGINSGLWVTAWGFRVHM